MFVCVDVLFRGCVCISCNMLPVASLFAYVDDSCISCVCCNVFSGASFSAFAIRVPCECTGAGNDGALQEKTKIVGTASYNGFYVHKGQHGYSQNK